MTIPVTFELRGKTCSGVLSQVSGAGSSATFHLMVNRFYWGSLHYIEGFEGFGGGVAAIHGGWRFNSPSFPELEDQAEYFGLVVQQWVDSH